MIALALAVSPMRGALALPMIADADDAPHCAEMQHDLQAADTLADMQIQATESGHKCEQGCNGSCCNGACNACVHGASAISDSIFVTPDFHDTPLTALFLVSFPERTVIPPLRPPASL